MISLIEFVTIASVATLTGAGASQGLNLLRQLRGSRAERPARTNNGEVSGRPASGAWHEPRYGSRYPVDCRIEYAIENQSFQGALVDMSRKGWRAKGLRPLATETTMKIYAYFPDVAHSILIDEAIVRWTDGLEFGVELTRINPEAAATLSQYLASHYSPHDPNPQYTLSPFSYN